MSVGTVLFIVSICIILWVGVEQYLFVLGLDVVVCLRSGPDDTWIGLS